MQPEPPSPSERDLWWSRDLQRGYRAHGTAFLRESGLLPPRRHWLLYRWVSTGGDGWSPNEWRTFNRIFEARERVPLLFGGIGPTETPLADPDRIRRYFAFARATVEGPSSHWTRERRRGDPHMRAIPDILRARIKAGVACEYRGAIADYKRGEARLGDVALRAKDEAARHSLEERDLIILGFLFHEISNALAMTGDRESFDYAEYSLGCYEVLLDRIEGSKRTPKHLRRVSEAGHFVRRFYESSRPPCSGRTMMARSSICGSMVRQP